MSSNKITLQQAMATLKSMFPDFETGVLRAVLYKTNGHMERTVELLLNMQNELQQTQVVTKNVDDVDDVRHTLEPDFLVYNISYSDDSTNVRSSVQQDLEDLKLAQSLQRQYNIEQGLEQAGLVPLGTFSKSHTKHKPHLPKRPNTGIQGSSEPSAFEKLSEFAKKKLKEFQLKFGRATAPNQRQPEYKSLLQNENADSDDEIELIETKKTK